MTFINLRKSEPPEPDSTVEEIDEVIDPENEPEEADNADESTEQEPEGTFLGPLPALVQGARNWCAWCSARIGAGPTLGVHIMAFYAAGHYGPWVTFGVLVPLAWAIAHFAPKEPFEHYAAWLDARDKAREERRRARSAPPEEKALEGPAEAAEEPPGDSLVTLMWQLIADASGVHVKTLAEVLAQAAEKAGQKPPSRADVEASLQDRNIPLRDSVRDTRGKVNKGVHRDDLKAWEEALSRTEPAPPTDPRSSDVATL